MARAYGHGLTGAGREASVSMLKVALGAWALLLAMFIFLVGHGLQYPLLQLRGSAEGIPVDVIGRIMSAYFIGFLVGSILVPRAVPVVGHIRVFAACAALASTTILVQAVVVEPVTWFAMRLLTGICYAGLYIVAESWINDKATNKTRGQLLSLYLMCQFAGVAIGQYLITAADVRGFELFILASILLGVGVLPILLTRQAAPEIRPRARMGPLLLLGRAPMAVVGVLLVGIGQGSYGNLGALYGQAMGLSVEAIARFLSFAIIGALVFQWPVGRLSDGVDRRVVLAVASLIAAGLAVAAVALGSAGLAATWALPAISFLFGGAIYPLYAVLVATANDRLQPDERVAAAGTLLLLYGVGGMMGPTVISLAMKQVGPAGFFLSQAVLFGLVGLYALWRMMQREPAVHAGTVDPVLPTTTAAATLAAAGASDAAASRDGGETGGVDPTR
ncbi:MAG: MFS transporter [Alphaproteobacteria bacterium]